MQHPECVAVSAYVNVVIYHLMHGAAPREVVGWALNGAAPLSALRGAIEAVPAKPRAELPNSGWVRHTLESVVWCSADDRLP